MLVCFSTRRRWTWLVVSSSGRWLGAISCVLYVLIDSSYTAIQPYMRTYVHPPLLYGVLYIHIHILYDVVRVIVVVLVVVVVVEYGPWHGIAQNGRKLTLPPLGNERQNPRKKRGGDAVPFSRVVSISPCLCLCYLSVCRPV